MEISFDSKGKKISIHADKYKMKLLKKIDETFESLKKDAVNDHKRFEEKKYEILSDNTNCWIGCLIKTYKDDTELSMRKDLLQTVESIARIEAGKIKIGNSESHSELDSLRIKKKNQEYEIKRYTEGKKFYTYLKAAGIAVVVGTGGVAMG